MDGGSDKDGFQGGEIWWRKDFLEDRPDWMEKRPDGDKSDLTNLIEGGSNVMDKEPDAGQI